MTTRRDYSNTAPKPCWTISNRLLYNKELPALCPLQS